MWIPVVGGVDLYRWLSRPMMPSDCTCTCRREPRGVHLLKAVRAGSALEGRLTACSCLRDVSSGAPWPWVALHMDVCMQCTLHSVSTLLMNTKSYRYVSFECVSSVLVEKLP